MHYDYDIAIVISDLGSGGAQRVVVQLVERWLQDNKTVAVITLAPTNTDFFKLSEKIDRYALNETANSVTLLGGFIANFKRIRKLRKIIKAIKPVNVISFLCMTNILTIIAAVRLPTRIIISERNDPAKQSFGYLWDMLRRKYYPKADRVTANTQAAIDTMSRYVPLAKLAYIQNPVLNRLSGESVLLSHPTILAVGRLHHQKGYDILLQAFSIFNREYPEWRLIILGDGPLKKSLQDQAKKLGIVDCVDWRGEVNNPFPYYQAAQLFVMSSRHEGMPNALLEAMQCHLPAIVNDALPGPLRYIEHNVSGLVVPVEDVPALAAALTRMASDADFRNKLAMAAKEKLKHHDIENVICAWNLLL